jgi:hypothetical protein
MRTFFSKLIRKISKISSKNFDFFWKGQRLIGAQSARNPTGQEPNMPGTQKSRNYTGQEPIRPGTQQARNPTGLDPNQIGAQKKKSILVF